MIQLIAATIGAFLAARVNTPTAAVTTVLSALPAAVAAKPELLASIGVTPPPGSTEELITQAVTAILALVLVIYRGKQADVSATLKSLFVAAAIGLFAQSEPVSAQQAATADLTFACTLPASRTDGTPISVDEIASINVIEARADGSLIGKVATLTKSPCGGTLTAIAGTHRYVVTATDTQGIESAPSNMVLVTTTKPGSPTGLQVRVVFRVAP